MSLLEFLFLGAVIGVLTSAPVGPVNIMTIRHAVQGGWRDGVLVGLGAACADTIFAAIAVFGISAVTRFIEGQVDIIKLVGGLLLIAFGIRIARARPHFEAGGTLESLVTDVTAAFFLTLTNPGAVLGFVAIIGGLGSWRPVHGDYPGAVALVCGVAAGALAWWMFLSLLVSRFSTAINDQWLGRANRIAGTLLVAFGLAIFADLAWRYGS